MNVDFQSDLTLQQQMFVAEYTVHFDGKRAALAAGYSEKSAQTQSYQLLQNPKIQKAITQTMQEYGDTHAILKQRIINELSLIAFSDFAEYVENGYRLRDISALKRKQTAVIKEIKVRRTSSDKFGESEETTIKLWSKEKALELLGKHLGIVIDRTEVTTKNPEAQKLLTFEEFCVNAGYPRPFPKQIEMKDFIVRGGPEKVEEPRLLLGSRGIGKTEYADILGLAYEIYLNPNDTTILSTKVQANGRRILKAMSRALSDNGIELEINNSDEIRVKGCTAKEHNVMLVTVGSGGFRSMHPHRVLFDDPVVPGKVSEADRAELQTSYEEAIKLTKNVAIIGQPVDFRDLYSRLRNIIRTMEVPHGSIPELDHDLDLQRASGVDEKSILASYFLKVSPEGDASFHDINVVDSFPKGKRSIGFIDPAEGGDYTAFGIFTDHFDGMAVVGFAFKKAWHLCIPEIKDACKKYGVFKLGFETNKFGVLPLQVLRENLAELNVSVEGKYTHSNKEARIELASQFSKSLYLSKESNIEYRRQVVEYSYDAKHDDAPDSIATFLEWAGKIRPPRAVKQPSHDL